MRCSKVLYHVSRFLKCVTQQHRGLTDEGVAQELPGTIDATLGVRQAVGHHRNLSALRQPVP
jgi:hypothetical protein